MKKNVGSTDKRVRIVLAIIFAVVAFKSSGVLMIIFGILAVVMFATSFMGFCPLYTAFGLNTKK